jgi:AhpC/TSA family
VKVAHPILFVLAAVTLINTAVLLQLVRRARAQVAIKENLLYGSRAQVAVGEVAPEFVASTLAGQELTHDRFIGRSVAFVFVSPNCGGCRKATATVVRVAPAAMAAAGVEFVLVSDAAAQKTRGWLKSLREDNGILVKLPVLVAPLSQFDMIARYNPDGLYPYFCVVDRDRRLAAHGPVGHQEWDALVREWNSVEEGEKSSLHP